MAAAGDEGAAVAQDANGSLLGSLYAWGGSWMTYAQEQLNSFLGWEDLDVVDPEAEGAHKGGAGAAQGYLTEERKEAWGSKQFQQYIGMDVTSLLSVPVWIMEPYTVLQKMAEIMEYTSLLDKADSCEDPFERFAWVTAYLVSPYGAAERTWKPFNPILGETFELEVGNGVRYLAEQVSHHPPVGAAHAENEHFTYDLVSAPATRFLGNSLEVYPYGRTRIGLRRSGELFTHTPANATVHNIVIGRTWLDTAGEFKVWNITTGASCVLNFTPCGWFSYGRYEFEGYISDKDRCKRIKVWGKWNSHCDMVRCDAQGNAAANAESVRLWTCSSKPKDDYYGATHFALNLNSCEAIAAPLPSDSRRRSDRAALQEGDTGRAGSEKVKLEELQRAEKKERERRNESWQPAWFRHVLEPKIYDEEPGVDKVPFFEWNGKWNTHLRAPTSSASEIYGKNFSPWRYHNS